MKFRLYVVVDREDENIVDEVKVILSKFNSSLSFSPSREQPNLAGCFEFYGTGQGSEDDIQSLIEKLNNDWDGEMNDCSAYGFNTTMFHPHVYYLQFQIF